jgi:hypothetical protein
MDLRVWNVTCTANGPRLNSPPSMMRRARDSLPAWCVKRVGTAWREPTWRVERTRQHSRSSVYARETLYALQLGRAATLPGLDSVRGAASPLRPAHLSDALPIAQLMARVTPASVARIELTDARDWERATTGAWAPRASISPLLRLAEGSAFVADGDAGELDGWVHIGVAREPGEQHPHSMRITTLPGVSVAPIIAASLAEISARATEAGTEGGAILAVVRSYESGVGAALRAHGFEEIADLRLAVRDARARVTAPGMVPAIG